MNRREAFKALLGLAGAGASVEAVAPEPQPLFYKLLIPHRLSDAQRHSIKQLWMRDYQASARGKLIILEDGVDLVAIREATEAGALSRDDVRKMEAKP